MSGGHTSHAYSNIEGSSKVDITTSSIGANSEGPNHNIVAENDIQANHGRTQGDSTIEGWLHITVMNGL